MAGDGVVEIRVRAITPSTAGTQALERFAG